MIIPRNPILIFIGIILLGIVASVLILNPSLEPPGESSLKTPKSPTTQTKEPPSKKNYQAPRKSPAFSRPPLQAPGLNPRIVIIRNPGLRDSSGRINDLEMKRTLNEALRLLFQADSGKAALKKVLHPRDKVGLKVNAYLGHKDNATHPALVNALAYIIRKTGVPENNIIIWDRSARELRMAGYKVNRSVRGVRCLTTLSSRQELIGSRPIMGFDKTPITVGQVKTKLSNILTKFTTVTINMPVLKTHKFKENTGVNTTLLNMYHAIELNKGNIKELYENECDPGAAEIYSIPQIKNKTRLIICDALNPLYNGGPMDDPRYHSAYNGLIVGTDPVALDIVGQSILQKIRQEKGDPKWPPLVSNYLITAGSAKYKLGQSYLDKIDIIKRTLR